MTFNIYINIIHESCFMQIGNEAGEDELGLSLSPNSSLGIKEASASNGSFL